MEIKRLDRALSRDEWINVVEGSIHITSIHEFEKSPIISYGYALLFSKKRYVGRLIWWGIEGVKIEMESKFIEEMYPALQSIAQDLGAELYYNKKEIFDPEKHLPKPKVKINRKKTWQDKSFGEGTRWMALTIKDARSFVESLSMKKVSQVAWSDGLAQSDNSRTCMITPSIEGYVFVTGIDLPHFVNALSANLPSEDLSLEVLTDQLVQLSKQYGEATYYEHYDRSMQLNGYFKAKDGKFIYGRWYADGQHFEQGKIPKELKKLINPESPMTPTAMEVSEIWAISPEDLVYFEVVKGAEVWVIEF
ncbi:MAG: hypothetical protein ABIV51_07815 [Saprospiraceae bacterium]